MYSFTKYILRKTYLSFYLGRLQNPWPSISCSVFPPHPIRQQQLPSCSGVLFAASVSCSRTWFCHNLWYIDIFTTSKSWKDSTQKLTAENWLQKKTAENWLQKITKTAITRNNCLCTLLKDKRWTSMQWSFLKILPSVLSGTKFCIFLMAASRPARSIFLWVFFFMCLFFLWDFFLCTLGQPTNSIPAIQERFHEHFRKQTEWNASFTHY